MKLSTKCNNCGVNIEFKKTDVKNSIFCKKGTIFKKVVQPKALVFYDSVREVIKDYVSKIIICPLCKNKIWLNENLGSLWWMEQEGDLKSVEIRRENHKDYNKCKGRWTFK